MPCFAASSATIAFSVSTLLKMSCWKDSLNIDKERWIASRIAVASAGAPSVATTRGVAGEGAGVEGLSSALARFFAA